MFDFAALRFTEDENLMGRVYWYLIGFPAAQGEEVLAPVGVHDRLQKARVERVCTADKEDAPYEFSLLKSVTAKYGRTTRELGSVTACDFGGRRYDSRHYTAFVALYADTMPEEDALGGLTVYDAPMSADDMLYRDMVCGKTVLLVGGEGKQIFRILWKFLKEDASAVTFLRGLGLGEGELLRLRSRLG